MSMMYPVIVLSPLMEGAVLDTLSQNNQAKGTRKDVNSRLRVSSSSLA